LEHPLDLEPVKRGFSAMAAEYDALSETHPVVIWMRQRIRALVESHLPAPGAILEINAGSGLDAAYFASRGYRVHALDIAPGMLESLASKAALPEAGGRLTWQALSFTDLDRLTERYDLVFSNLGGLNCISDLQAFTRHLRRVLKPGGKAVLVLMPPWCPWELLQLVRGHYRTATRRLGRKATQANVGGATVPVWYHTPGRIEAALGPGFRTLALRSFCLYCPPSYFQGLSRRFPSLIRLGTRLDDALGGTGPLNRWGDFYALVVQSHTAG
jgi:ubiquinone/menaquinone biosynthesis C-methylase UbiE